MPAGSDSEEGAQGAEIHGTDAGHDRAVPDPYYGGDREFAEMFEIIDRSSQALADDLVKRVQGS